MPYRKSVTAALSFELSSRGCHSGLSFGRLRTRCGRLPGRPRSAGPAPTRRPAAARCSGPAPAARQVDLARLAARTARPQHDDVELVARPGRRAGASVRSTQARPTLPATASEAAITSGSAGSAARSQLGQLPAGGRRQADLGAEAVHQPPQRRGDVRVGRPDPAVPGVGGRRGRRPPVERRVPGPAQQRGGRPAQRQRARRCPAGARPAPRPRCAPSGHGDARAVGGVAAARPPPTAPARAACAAARPRPPSMIWAAAIPVSSEISAFQSSTSSRRADLHGPAAVRRAHHLLLGQLQLDRPAVHRQPPAQPAELGQPRDGRVQPARLVVGLHARVVQPGPGAHHRAAHVDRDRLAGRRPGRCVHSTAARGPSGSRLAASSDSTGGCSGTEPSGR